MEKTDAYWQVYTLCLNTATRAGSEELNFWRTLIDAMDRGTMDIEGARTLITATSVTLTHKVSRATAYRLIDRWRPIIEDLANPGRGS